MSHDQGFLDNVCTDIIHLDMHKLFYYRGNYTMFRKMLVQKRIEQQKDYDKQEKKLKELKRSGQNSKKAEIITKKEQQKKITKGKGGHKDDRDDEDSAATATLLQRPKDYIVKFRFPEPPPLQPPVLGLHDVKFKYPTAKDFIFTEIEFGIDMDSRIAIVGPNGVRSYSFKILQGLKNLV